MFTLVKLIYGKSLYNNQAGVEDTWGITTYTSKLGQEWKTQGSQTSNE